MRHSNECGLANTVVRRLSLVDAVSFVTMRQGRLEDAFAFDPDFEQERFSLVS
jgi:predicted nucleic acid-binding protein